MTGNQTAKLREQLIYLLNGGGAHLSFDKAVAGLPVELRGARPPGIPHTPWRLLDHLRIAQWDILEFTRKASHVSPPWPEGYWPTGDAPPDDEAWDRSVAAFQADLRAMQNLVADPATDLLHAAFARPGADGPPRGPAGRRPQRLSPRSTGHGPTALGRTESGDTILVSEENQYRVPRFCPQIFPRFSQKTRIVSPDFCIPGQSSSVIICWYAVPCSPSRLNGNDGRQRTSTCLFRKGGLSNGKKQVIKSDQGHVG